MNEHVQCSCNVVALLYIPRDPRCVVEKLARVFAAIDSTVEALKQYYEHQEDEAMWGVKGPYPLDDIYNCKKFGDHEWLFEAKRVQDDREVCVKFVRSHYGYVVHKFLADNDLAPKLHSYDLALPGGWFAVIMDKVEGTPVRSNELTPSQKRSCSASIIKGKLCPWRSLPAKHFGSTKPSLHTGF